MDNSSEAGGADEKDRKKAKSAPVEYLKASAYAVFWHAKQIRKVWRKKMRAGHRAKRDRRRRTVEAWREGAATDAP
jgi:hypothetical protein